MQHVLFPSRFCIALYLVTGGCRKSLSALSLTSYILTVLNFCITGILFNHCYTYYSLLISVWLSVVLCFYSAVCFSRRHKQLTNGRTLLLLTLKCLLLQLFYVFYCIPWPQKCWKWHITCYISPTWYSSSRILLFPLLMAAILYSPS